MQNAISKKKYKRKPWFVCPPGLCMSSKPGCNNRGGKVIQVKPRDPKSDDEKMRCCGEETCEMPSSSKRLQEQSNTPKMPNRSMLGKQTNMHKEWW